MEEMTCIFKIKSTIHYHITLTRGLKPFDGLAAAKEDGDGYLNRN